MAKVMIFIDGSWLYRNLPRLRGVYGQQDFRVDFGKLPLVLAEEVGKQIGTNAELDIVRVNLFGSFAANYDIRDKDSVKSQRDFYDMLKEEYHYEVETFPINFKGRRLRRAEREVGDTFEPQEKCVDIALATCMMFYAAIPSAFDIAVIVTGDQDFKPALQHTRKLGRRVAIASIKESCSMEFADPRDEARVKDFDTIWLDDILSRLELKYERHLLECASPLHKGDRKVWTTFYPRKGQKFYCPDCLTEMSRIKQELQQEFVSAQSTECVGEAGDGTMRLGQGLSGMVKKKVADRGYGFIQTFDGQNYFFHLSDLMPDLEFDDVMEGLQVDFEVKKTPSLDKAGAAQNVRRHAS